MTSKETVLAQIEDASRGFDALLDNRLLDCFAILRSQPNSAPHLVGTGIASFLKAILSREDAELREATETLVKAEAVATAETKIKRPKGDSTGVYPAGIEYKLFQADAVLGQALVAVMSESYVEFAKAIWKLNTAYKLLATVQKTVFPDGVGENESLESVFTKLNEHYLEATTAAQAPAAESGGGFFSSWGRKRAPAVAASLRHSSSSSAIPTLHAPTPTRSGSASVPGSHVASENASVTDLVEGVDKTALVATAGDGAEEHPAPLWAGDRLTTTVISGAALGAGMFGLIFSMMPPRMVKLISWFGFAGSSRQSALKLLAVSAATGDDVHGYFASLTLVTFYGFILLMSGWQSSESTYLATLSRTLGRVTSRFPNGTLWVLNRAKLARYSRDPDTAIAIIVEALAKEKKEGNSFREADSLLVFELGWLKLSQAKWVETADAFEQMCDLNSWSHATYIAIAAGALIDELNTQRLASPSSALDAALVSRTESLLERLPGLCQQKRVFGEKPVTETFIVRRAEVHRVKRERWVQRGRVKPEAGVWEVVRLTNAMELGLFWATVGGRSPPSGIRTQIDLLSAFHPHPRLPASTSSAGSSLSARPASPTPSRTPSTLSTSSATAGKWGIDPQTSDLDTPAEILIRDLILGVLYAALAHYEPAAGHFATATHLLDGVLAASDAELGDEKWARAFAGWHRAVVELRIGDTAECAGEGKVGWSKRAKRADEWLAAVLALPEFDMKTRLESRVLMLRDEIAMRKAKLGLA
ncbi:hypothetical protein JCM3775_006276 [Rhodotorula graminis]|uniref:Mitochondrial outer membrane protein IML2 n=1 Tax=Rhodotorula graminis (strain WP1) TaxID=578459 RepID=A0A194S289_RHOGW|nr:uncharacterized protein RHOBADRAFT_53599 [Rhodotorula graminis WP1]KPV74634.1 hypothetical protein RHOBADRAFT_53599 [Rhodotorula graminis WP1]